MEAVQGSSDSFRGDMTTEELTRTIRLRLEGADWKHDRVRRAIDEWQEVARYTADILPSFPSHRWDSRDTQLRRVVRSRFSNPTIYAHDRDAAVAKARDAFDGWNKRGQPGGRPQGRFGNDDYLVMSTSSSSKKRRQIVENDRGFGVELSLINDRGIEPSTIWFHATVGDYQREYLQKVIDEEADLGTVELRYDDHGQLWAHVSITDEIEVFEPGDVETIVGVSFGAQGLWAASVVGPNGIQTVEIESGREFHHYREQFRQRRSTLSEKGDLRGLREMQGEQERYTEQVTHTATRRIVDLAADHAPCMLRFEDPSEVSQTVGGADHNWPRGMLTTQLSYKSTEAGLPVEAIGDIGADSTCRTCGETDSTSRDGAKFRCQECGYEVHRGVNAAINVAHPSPLS